MKADPGLQATRDIRLKISRELGNDPHRLVEYYMKYQRRFGDRLCPAPDADATESEEITEQGAAADGQRGT